MGRAIVINASVIIAHFTPGDVHSARAFEILDTAEELAIHRLTIAEVLARPARDDAGDTVVAALRNSVFCNHWLPMTMSRLLWLAYVHARIFGCRITACSLLSTTDSPLLLGA